MPSRFEAAPSRRGRQDESVSEKDIAAAARTHLERAQYISRSITSTEKVSTSITVYTHGNASRQLIEHLRYGAGTYGLVYIERKGTDYVFKKIASS